MARRHPQPPATAEQVLTLRRIGCTTCGHRLTMAHHTQRTIRRLDGVWRLTLALRMCRHAPCPRYRIVCRPEEEGSWALPYGEFGFDVIALVGQLRYAQHSRNPC